jgi:hypothetical protein
MSKLKTGRGEAAGGLPARPVCRRAARSPRAALLEHRQQHSAHQPEWILTGRILSCGRE